MKKRKIWLTRVQDSTGFVSTSGAQRLTEVTKTSEHHIESHCRCTCISWQTKGIISNFE